jgi:hypothetical protein
MRVRVTVTAAVLGLTFATVANASPQRVVLVRPEVQDPVLLDAWNRLSAELKIDRFSVQIVDGATVDTAPAALSEVARKLDALAAINLVSETGKTSVDVWLVDRVSGKTTMRTVVVRKSADASSVLAIRAVELLRASLREFESDERPPADVAGVDRRPVPPAAVRLASRPEPRIRLRAEALLLEEGARFGAALGPALGVYYRATERFELGVVASGPLLGAKLDTAAGSATTHQELGVVDARFWAFRSTSIAVGVNAAMGVHFLSAVGQAVAPLVSRSDHLATFAGAVGLSGDVRLSPRIAFGASLRALAFLPNEGVAVAHASGVLAVPTVLVSAGIAVGL